MFVEALVRLLIADHKKEAIKGNVLALGKQTIALPLSKILEIFEEQDCKINPKFNLDSIRKDNDTRHRIQESINDEDFFQLFGDIKYDTMDVTSYENPSLIHNLNYPIPKKFEEKFDYIIDGGTFDHIFDIKNSFQNVVKMLKPGGRIFQWNAASNYANAAYVSFSADFFHDFYVLNKFKNCRTFFAESVNMAAQNWCLYEFIPQAGVPYPHFRNGFYYNMVLVFAQKTKESTFDKMPIQVQYSDEQTRADYVKNKNMFSDTPFIIKTPKTSKINISWKNKILYKLHSKPDPSVYKYIGWL